MRQAFWQNGFLVINDVYNSTEIEEINRLISLRRSQNSNFRQKEGLFAIRNFLNEIPDLTSLLWNNKLKNIIQEVGNEHYQNVKSIYFDKPPNANWVVSWHQDLTISVNEKEELSGFRNWTKKEGLSAVQPPIEYLNEMFTIRIHLDACDHRNGALNVIAGSHKNGILSTTKSRELIERTEPIECKVEKGGIMLMHPLLLHSSRRTSNNLNRRVIHLEFCDKSLPGNLMWRELKNVFMNQ